jgi:hypothetical protein
MPSARERYLHKHQVKDLLLVTKAPVVGRRTADEQALIDQARERLGRLPALTVVDLVGELYGRLL